MQKSAVFLTAFLLLAGIVQAQNRNDDNPQPHRLAEQTLLTALDSIQQIIGLWNDAFNERDTASYYALADTAIAVTSGNGTQTGILQFAATTRRLLAKRPGMVMYLNASATEINDAWHLAYDSGEWTETWTEQNDRGKSEISGKYWRMWRKSGDNWKVMSLVLTPLSCKGSYCNQ